MACGKLPSKRRMSEGTMKNKGQKGVSTALRCRQHCNHMDPSTQPLALYGGPPLTLQAELNPSTVDKYDVRALLDSIDLSSCECLNDVDDSLDEPPDPSSDSFADLYQTSSISSESGDLRSQDYSSVELASHEHCPDCDQTSLHSERYSDYYSACPLPPPLPSPNAPDFAGQRRKPPLPPPPSVDYSSYVPASILSAPSFVSAVLTDPTSIPPPSQHKIMALAASRSISDSQFEVGLMVLDDAR